MKRAASRILQRVSTGALSHHQRPYPPSLVHTFCSSSLGPPSLDLPSPAAAHPTTHAAPTSPHATAAPQPASGLQTLCKLTVIGRTGTKPHLHTFPNGRSSLRLRVATNHLQRGADGEREVATQWLTVFVSDHALAFDAVRDVPVGSLLYVEGSLRLVDRPSVSGAPGFANVHVDRAGVLRVLQWNRSRDDDDDEDMFPTDM